MKNTKRFREICSRLSLESAVKAFFTAFLGVSFATLLFHTGDYGYLGFIQENMDAARFSVYFLVLIATSVAFFALDIAFSKYKVVEICLFAFAAFFSLAVISGAEGIGKYKVFGGVFIACLIVLNYVIGKDTFSVISEEFRKGVRWSFVALFSTLAFLAVALIGIYRYASYSSPNFDFGIWCNMFHNMKESGLPLTTCERDGVLSHFAVHFSPIYYVMLPFYIICPKPELLQVLQAAVLYSGVVPLYLLAVNKGLTHRKAMILSLIYSLYPAIAAGTFYDLHENCFLLPLLLWVFFFFENGNNTCMWIFAVLTLLVKEDAFIYILIFSSYVFFRKGKKKTALLLFAVSAVYFAAVSGLMNAFGNGIMSNRYENLSFDGSLVGVVKTVILNPAYLFTQIFEAKNGGADKILYVTQLLLPLCFLPFVTKKISVYILSVPILLNLITMYVYQPNISFQYSFGITAFLFYAATLNLSELPEVAKKYTLGVSFVAGLLLFSMIVVGNLGYYGEKYHKNKDLYERMDYALEGILSTDSSVAASAFLLPHIADRSEIYEVKYHKENGKYKTDVSFVVLDIREAYLSESEPIKTFYLENGYKEVYYDEGAVIILEKE